MTKFERCEQEERQTETLAQNAAVHLQAQREQSPQAGHKHTHKKVGQIPARLNPSGSTTSLNQRGLSSPCPGGSPARTRMPQWSFTGFKCLRKGPGSPGRCLSWAQKLLRLWWRCCKQGPCVSAQLLHFLGQRKSSSPYTLHPHSHPFTLQMIPTTIRTGAMSWAQMITEMRAFSLLCDEQLYLRPVAALSLPTSGSHLLSVPAPIPGPRHVYTGKPVNLVVTVHQKHKSLKSSKT